MIIEAKIFSTLRHYLPNSPHHLEGAKWDMPEGATVAQVLKILNIPENETKILLINGRNADKERVLNDGDVFHVFPLMAGG